MSQKTEALDTGWVELMLDAQKLGLTYEEVEKFIQSQSTKMVCKKEAEEFK